MGKYSIDNIIKEEESIFDVPPLELFSEFQSDRGDNKIVYRWISGLRFFIVKRTSTSEKLETNESEYKIVKKLPIEEEKNKIYVESKIDVTPLDIALKSEHPVGFWVPVNVYVGRVAARLNNKVYKGYYTLGRVATTLLKLEEEELKKVLPLVRKEIEHYLIYEFEIPNKVHRFMEGFKVEYHV